MRFKLAALFLAVFGVLAWASPAQAADPKPEHKTVTTTVTDRADSGNHGIWATDTITRKVELTGGPAYVLPGADAQATQATVEKTKTEHPEFTVCDLTDFLNLRWSYTAEVTDTGDFVTLGGAALSPNDGKALTAGAKGTVKGSFTATFTAPAHWCTYDAKPLQGKTLKGDAAPKTSEWVKSLFTDGFAGTSINDDWTWTYETCVEKWWDAADPKSNDGESDAAGDITGKACPTKAPTASPVATRPAATVPAGTGGGKELALTGPSIAVLTGIGALIVGAGGGLFLLGRRRKTEFEA